MKALAKGLPIIATGVRNAVLAFQSGDKFGGSAAVMDICAGAASMLGSLSAAGGPPGALIGAVFSIVSMILKMFVPAQTSLTEKLEQMYRTIAAEQQLQNLAVASAAIRSFVTAVSTDGTKWTLKDYDGALALNKIEGNTINSIRFAANWLEETKNRDLDLWPVILASQCQTYILFKTSQTLALFQLNEDEKKKNQEILKFNAQYSGNDIDQLNFLKRIAHVTQQRGRIWHLGTDSGVEEGNLYVSDSISDGWKKVGGEQRVFTIAQRHSGDYSQRHPHYATFCLEQADGPRLGDLAQRDRRNARTYGLFGELSREGGSRDGWHEIPELQGCNDICATPGFAENEVHIYAARAGKIERYSHSGGRDSSGHLVKKDDADFRLPANAMPHSVNVVRAPQFIVSGDGSPADAEKYVLYAGVQLSEWRPVTVREAIWAFFDGSVARTIDFPWAGGGVIKADRKYLWAFTRTSIACVSHAQVKHAARGKNQPPWLCYDVPEELKAPYSSMPFRFGFQTEAVTEALRSARAPDALADDLVGGIVDLAPCDDGTLVAVFTHGTDRKKIYHAVPKIDLRMRTLVIEGTRTDAFNVEIKTNGWIRRQDGSMANRIQKEPIFCNSLLNELANTLATTSAIPLSVVVPPAPGV